MKVAGFAGFFGSGKTTLIEQLIPALRRQGLRVSVVKHAHHRFDIDHPGKDTYRHREAGAFEVVAASDRRLALMREFEQAPTLSVHQVLAELCPDVDWGVVGGEKRKACATPGTTAWSPWPPTQRTACPCRRRCPCSTSTPRTRSPAGGSGKDRASGTSGHCMEEG